MDWSVAKHDTVGIGLWINPLEAHVYLAAFLNAEGETFARPYEPVRHRIESLVAEVKSREWPGQAPRADVSDERIRTWKSLFESLGLLLVDPDTRIVRASPLGRAVRAMYSELNNRIEGANDHLAALATRLLVRHRLRNPIDGGDYPEDSDLHPFRFIWRAMRALDDRLHWEELNRVLMHVNYRHEEDDAIAHISELRKSLGGSYTTENVGQLGEPAVEETDETLRRITPWFSRAGFGGLLISAEADEHGFRHLEAKYKPLIDVAIDEEVTLPSDALNDRASYLKYLTALPQLDESVPAGDEAQVKRVQVAVERYGSKKIICLAGLPGTGKTRLARQAAVRLVDGDPYRLIEVQFHENRTYDSFVEGFVPKPSGEGFELRPKVLRIINRRALLDPQGLVYVLLIEELTRANVHALLGELLTYIEHRDRSFQWAISQDEDRIAPNLVVLATMNPRDRSAVVLDDALLRRLHQIALRPSVEVLRSMLTGLLEPALLDTLCAWFEKFIGLLPFGHGEFADVRSEDDLRSLWRGTLRYFLTDTTGEIRAVFKEVDAQYPWA